MAGLRTRVVKPARLGSRLDHDAPPFSIPHCVWDGEESCPYPTLIDVSRAVRTSAVPIVGVAHLLYAHMRMAPIAPRVSA